MEIESLHIDRFGILREKRLEKLSPHVEVIYAPNEAGKTTLLQFIRCMFFGLRAGEKYVVGKSPKFGGWLKFRKPLPGNRDELITISRHLRFPAGSQNDTVEAETVELRNESGDIQSADTLGLLLGNVNSSLFNAVFAVSLSDINAFDVLDHSAASQALYGMTLGQPQVSLIELQARLQKKRLELVNNAPKSEATSEGLLGDLIRQRQETIDLLEQSQQKLEDGNRLKTQISSEKQQLEQLENQISRLNEQEAQLNRYLQAYPLYRQYCQMNTASYLLNTELSASAREINPYTLDQAKKLETEIAGLKSQIEIVKQKYEQAKNQPSERSNNIVRISLEEIKSLAHQKSAFLKRKQLKQQSEVVKAKIDSAWQSFGMPIPLSESAIPAESVFSELRSVWKSRNEQELIPAEIEPEEDTEEMAEGIETTEETVNDSENTAIDEVDDSLAIGQKIKAINDRLQLLREKLRLLERHRDLVWGESQLRIQLFQWSSAPAIPASIHGSMMVITGLGVLGLILWTMYLLGWISRSGTLASLGSMGVVLCFCGLSGVAILRYIMEKNAEEKMIECRRQWETTSQQLEKIEKRRQELESQLRNNSNLLDLPPIHGGETPNEIADTRNAIALLLAQIRQLEQSVLSNKSAATERQARIKTESTVIPDTVVIPAPTKVKASIRPSVPEYKNKYTAEQFESIWRQALQKLRLPSDWKIEQVKALYKKSEWFRQGLSRLEQLETQIDQLNKTLLPYENQLRQLTAGNNTVDGRNRSEIERIDELIRLYKQSVKESKQQSGQLLSQIHQQGDKLAGQLRLAEEKLAFILTSENVSDVAQLQAKAGICQQNNLQRQQKNRLIEQLKSSLNLRNEDEIRNTFSEYSDSESITDQIHTLKKQGEENQIRRNQIQAKIAELQQQTQTIFDSDPTRRETAHLEELEHQIEQTSRQWRSTCLAEIIVERLIDQYELNRQPETLQTAGFFFEQITNGAYTQVGRDIDSRQIWVAQKGGAIVQLEHLSTGTKEQLYLCIRLALANWFAQRGTRLPIIIDDALVNYDSKRADAVARLIQLFAQRGNQIIVFTCHKAIRNAFQQRGINVRCGFDDPGKTAVN